MKVAVFIGFADARTWNALSVTAKNKVSKTAGFFIYQTIHKLQN